MKQVFLTTSCIGLIIGLIGKMTDSPTITKIGLLRGKVVEYYCGKIEIRTCFGNKLLWSSV